MIDATHISGSSPWDWCPWGRSGCRPHKRGLSTIAAVVATHNRPDLLGSRSLASIARQTRPPDYLVVIDDSDLNMRPANAEAVAAICSKAPRSIT